MKYICTEDIEKLAAQGKRELVLEENTVLMDLARDLARQMGIAIVSAAQPTPVKSASTVASSTPAKPAPPAAPAPSTREAAPGLNTKPRGCQHGPLTVTTRQSQPNTHPSLDGVVDQLVELVRQSTGKRSGN